MTSKRAFLIFRVPCRRLGSAGLVLVLLAGFAAGRRAQAVDYTWGSATSGNWTDATKWNVGAGYPDDSTATATLSATGSNYTVTFPLPTNATPNPADVTLNSLTISSANATLFLRAIRQDAVQKLTRLTSQNAVSNVGTIDLYAAGVHFWGENVYFGVSSGALTNSGTVKARLGGQYLSFVDIFGDVTNDSTGSMSFTLQDGRASGTVTLSKTAGTYVNRGAWTAQSGVGVSVTGNGTSFTQDQAGASLSVPGGFTLGALTNTAANTFNVSEGSVSGVFTFHRTAVSLGSAVTVTSPTTFRFRGDNFINTWTGDVRSNMTLDLTPAGTSDGAFVDATGSFQNSGTIAVVHNGGWVPNGSYGRLQVLNSGTLTNANALNFSVGRGNFTPEEATLVQFSGDLVNAAEGTISMTTTGTAASGSRQVQFTKSNAIYRNSGLVSMAPAATNPNLDWAVLGGTSTLTNEVGGVIRYSGTSVATAGSISGAATSSFRNLGTLEVLSGTATASLTVSLPVAGDTFAFGDLTEGGWRVVSGGSAATLSVTTTDTIRQIANSAVVTLDGALATFTQLERAGDELRAVLDGGRLNVRGGKSFTATANFSLENGGILQVGGAAGDAAEFRVGASGTGTLDNAGLLLGHGAVRGSVINGLAGSGTVAPGSSPGILTIDGDYDQYGLGSLDIEIFSLGAGETIGTAGVNFDQLVVTGATSFAEQTTLTLSFDAVGGEIDWTNEFWDASHTGTSGWKILEGGSAITGLGNLVIASNYLDSTTTALGSVRPAASFSTQQVGTDVYVVYSVPEPATLALVGVGIAAGAYAIRRRRQV